MTVKKSISLSKEQEDKLKRISDAYDFKISTSAIISKAIDSLYDDIIKKEER